MRAETTGSEIKDYVVIGDYVTEEGDVRFRQENYHTTSPESAIAEARRDGLVRLTFIRWGEK